MRRTTSWGESRSNKACPLAMRAGGRRFVGRWIDRDVLSPDGVRSRAGGA
ncbi:hypothetical protein [Thermaerobacter subterraneus]|uniref:Uncharacterized protein n=1 Tax=Thermaerobacter subterraneus DSM 13965 TaxID=867903 RepID=K6P2D8_9FIRM|nr:hypothetical protein [Thermaerobacter subterraneus]EKP95235.1 hypothetical protein ThesuDRAFT_00977 [Thermaerobacter subterraneus DSM 13965]